MCCTDAVYKDTGNPKTIPLNKCPKFRDTWYDIFLNENPSDIPNTAFRC